MNIDFQGDTPTQALESFSKQIKSSQTLGKSFLKQNEDRIRANVRAPSVDKWYGDQSEGNKAAASTQFQSENFPHSAFGDGDGSFWDRWLNMPNIDSSYSWKYSPRSSKVNDSYPTPYSGFKRSKLKTASISDNKRQTLNIKERLPSIKFNPDPANEQYFGNHARMQLLEEFRTMNSPIRNVDNDDAVNRSDTSDISSPRMRFLSKCRDSGILPEVRIVLRRHQTDEIDLRHSAMGDKLGCALANAITENSSEASSSKTLPRVKSLLLGDSRLTDESLAPILRSVNCLPDLLKLDLSYNKIDDAASEALAAYLSVPNCSIQELILAHADIDDDECANFVHLLENNSRLLVLDLSHNLIGSSEVKNICNPDFETGGEALAGLIRNPISCIRKLNLSWNMIRGASAVSVGRSIMENKSIVELDLSYNSIGLDGGLAIAESLAWRPTSSDYSSIEMLGLSGNGITGNVVMALSCALLERKASDCGVNRPMLKLFLDENPIGKDGAKEAMVIASEVGDSVLFSMKSCNTTLHADTHAGLVHEPTIRNETGSNKDSKHVPFDEINPSGTYELSLQHPYDRAVFHRLCQCLTSEKGAIIQKAGIYRVSNNLKKDIVGELVSATDGYILDNFAKYSDIRRLNTESKVSVELHLEVKETQRKSISGINCKLLDNNILAFASDTFNNFDVDGSNSIDRDELRNILNSLGLHFEDSRIEEVFSLFDSDGSGSIGKGEFLDFIIQTKQEIEVSMEGQKILCLKSSTSTVSYVPPRTGTLKITISNKPIKPDPNKTIPRGKVLELLAAAAMSDDGFEMILLLLPKLQLGAPEAKQIFDFMMRNAIDKATIAAEILPQIPDPRHVALYLESIFPIAKTGNAHGMSARIRQNMLYRDRVRQITDHAYPIMFGMSSGYYCLDLTKKWDRIAARKILETEVLECKLRTEENAYDTGQLRNHHNYRNAYFNGSLIDLSPESFDPFPDRGILEFSFTSSDHPVTRYARIMASENARGLIGSTEYPCINAISRDRFEVIIQELILPDNISSFKSTLDQHLSKYERDMSTLHGCLGMSKNRAQRISLTTSAMYGDLWLVLDRDSDKLLHKDDASSLASGNSSSSSIASLTRRPVDDADAYLLKSMLLLEYSKFKSRQGVAIQADDSKKHPKLSSLPLIRIFKSSATGEAMQYLTDDDMIDCIKALPDTIIVKSALLDERVEAATVQSDVQILRIIKCMPDVFAARYLTSAQLYALLSMLPDCAQWREGLGTLRCDVAVILFNKIADVHNFQNALLCMTPEEHAAVIFRIGYLNLFNPCRLGGYIQLCLGRVEERNIAKMLLHASFAEEGENLVDESFAWSRSEEIMPGWAVPETWMKEDGMPTKGVFTVNFFSGSGARWDVRSMLRAMVFVQDPVDELSVKSYGSAEDANTSMKSYGADLRY